MDLTNLALAVAVAIGLISADAVWNAHNMSVEITVAQAQKTAGWEEEFVEELFVQEVKRITAFPSVVSAPTLRSKSEKTAITVLAEAMHLGDLTYAAQDMFGVKPVRLIGSIVADDKELRMILTGHSRASGDFEVVVTEPKDVGKLVRRAAFEAVTEIDPYLAAVTLFEKGLRNGDLTAAKAVIAKAKAELPPTPLNQQRSYFENLEGIIALQENDVPRARKSFDAAVDSWPQNPAAVVNLAFAQEEQDQYEAAARTARRVVDGMPDAPAAIRSAAYITMGVSAWARGDHRGADKLFAKAAEEQPTSSAAYEHWSSLLAEMGRPAEAEVKARRGRQNLEAFENYVEVAALYFRLTEKDNQPLVPRQAVR